MIRMRHLHLSFILIMLFILVGCQNGTGTSPQKTALVSIQNDSPETIDRLWAQTYDENWDGTVFTEINLSATQSGTFLVPAGDNIGFAADSTTYYWSVVHDILEDETYYWTLDLANALTK